MQLTIEVLSTVRVCVAVISVIAAIVIAIRAYAKAHRKEPLSLQASSLMASLLLINCVLGLPGLDITKGNGTILTVDLLAITFLLFALNIFVWRASKSFKSSQ